MSLPPPLPSENAPMPAPPAPAVPKIAPVAPAAKVDPIVVVRKAGGAWKFFAIFFLLLLLGGGGFVGWYYCTHLMNAPARSASTVPTEPGNVVINAPPAPDDAVLRQQLAAAKNDVEKLRGEMESQKKTILDAQAALSDAVAEIEALKSKTPAAGAGDAELAKLKAMQQEMVKTWEAERSQNSAAMMEETKKRAEAETKEAELKAANKQMTEATASFKEQYAKLSQEKVQLEEKLKIATSKEGAAPADGLKAQIDAWQKATVAAQAALSRELVNNQAKEMQIRDLQEKLNVAAKGGAGNDAEIEKLRDAIVELKKAKADAEAAQKTQIAELAKQNEQNLTAMKKEKDASDAEHKVQLMNLQAAGEVKRVEANASITKLEQEKTALAKLTENNRRRFSSAGKISSVNMQHNVTIDGQQGVAIKVAFTVSGMKDIAGLLACWPVDANGKYIGASAVTPAAFRDGAGNVVSLSHFTPNQDNAAFNGEQLFIPYAAFPRVDKQTTVKLRIFVFTGDMTADESQYRLATDESQSFQLRGN